MVLRMCMFYNIHVYILNEINSASQIVLNDLISKKHASDAIRMQREPVMRMYMLMLML